MVEILFKAFNLVNICFVSFMLNGNIDDEFLQIQADGNVQIHGQYARNLELNDLNGILNTVPTRSKFVKIRGESLGCKYFFYQELGLIAYSGPTKRRASKYYTMNIEACFAHNKLYKPGKLYDSGIIINNVSITKDTKFDDIYKNLNLKNFINSKIYSDPNKPVRWLIELLVNRTQVSIKFSGGNGDKIESVRISLL
jgi:hypothetical protein